MIEEDLRGPEVSVPLEDHRPEEGTDEDADDDIAYRRTITGASAISRIHLRPGPGMPTVVVHGEQHDEVAHREL